MTQSNDPVRRFVPGRLTVERMNEVIDSLAATSRRVNSIENPANLTRAAGPLPVKITDIVAVGKYYGLAYLPPYKASEADPDAIADLATTDLGGRTAEVILWNLSELSGGAALAVDDWVDASVAGLDPSGYPLMKTGGGGGGGAKLMIVKEITGDYNRFYARCRTWTQDETGTPVEGDADIIVWLLLGRSVGDVIRAIQISPWVNHVPDFIAPHWMELLDGAAVPMICDDAIEYADYYPINTCYPIHDDFLTNASGVPVRLFHRPHLGEVIYAVPVPVDYAYGHPSSDIVGHAEYVEIPSDYLYHGQGDLTDFAVDTYPRVTTWSRVNDGTPIKLPRERTDPATGTIYRWYEIYDQHGKLWLVSDEMAQASGTSDPHDTSSLTHTTSDGPVHLTSVAAHTTSDGSGHVRITSASHHLTSSTPGGTHLTSGPVPTPPPPHSTSAPSTTCPSTCIGCSSGLAVSYTAPAAWDHFWDGAYVMAFDNGGDPAYCEWTTDYDFIHDQIAIYIFCFDGQWIAEVHRWADGINTIQRFIRIAPANGDGDCPQYLAYYVSPDGGQLLVTGA